jgi:hypothetical protein
MLLRRSLRPVSKRDGIDKAALTGCLFVLSEAFPANGCSGFEIQTETIAVSVYD